MKKWCLCCYLKKEAFFSVSHKRGFIITVERELWLYTSPSCDENTVESFSSLPSEHQLQSILLFKERQKNEIEETHTKKKLCCL